MKNLAWIVLVWLASIALGQTEVVYRHVDGKDLKLDVRLPDAEGRRPAIIWVHGGGLSSGAKDMPGSLEVRLAEEFARRGYVCLSISYRLRSNPEPVFNDAMLDAMSDLMSSVRWARANANEYRIDPERIAIAGYSAGAEIAVNLAYSDFHAEDPKVAAVIDLAGNRIFWGKRADPGPPCLILHGTADDINPFSASEELVKQLGEMRTEVELVPLEGASHFLGSQYDRIVREIDRFLAGRLNPD